MIEFRVQILTLLVALTASVTLARLTTKELLECRANLTVAVKNDTTFLKKVHEADFIFTGKIKELRHGHLHIRVKRAIKGILNSTVDLALNDTCGVYVRRSYTGIFMGKRDTGESYGNVVMHFGPVPLTLTNLDRLNAAVRGKTRR